MQRPQSEGKRSASLRQPIVSRSLQFSTGHRFDDHSNPRRPNTTPKPRIQRLLPAPGQNTARVWHSSPQLIVQSPSILIQLPNSPPRLCSVNFITSPDVEEKQLKPELVMLEKSAASSLPYTSICHSTLEPARSSSHFWLFNGNTSCDSINEGSTETTSIPDSSISFKSTENEKERDTNHEPEDGVGPNFTETCSINDGPESLLKSFANGDDEDDEYSQLLADRAQVLDDEAKRQQIREELESYVNSLGSRTDDNGEHLVEFPRNYQQIVSLMTQKDVQEENDKSQDGQSIRPSWSHVLIESGLSKQQAFGILEEADDDVDGNSSLAAKIALKMAYIRQLDIILEEKLGKNLYSNIIPRKQKRAKLRQVPIVAKEITSSASQIFMTQTKAIVSQFNSIETILKGNYCTKKSNNFIERNKQVVANGMKANMTKEEEDRLAQLLSDESFPAMDSQESDEENNNTEASVLKECNEYTMEEAEKVAIQKLIAVNDGVYPLFASDELQDGLTDDTLESNQLARNNVIHETKRDRLQRQRLSRVEQELRFLKESPSVVIVGDEDDNDDCRSEISYATVASSTCSTRSGVISRHDFKCFLAQQKKSFHSTPTASAEEIRQLLLALDHGSATSSNFITAPTG